MEEKEMLSNTIKKNLSTVLKRIHETRGSTNQISNSVRLVAVSKTFPVESIIACYDEGQRHFGENYAQELFEKAETLKDKCSDIQWHFIGRLQSNKKLCELSNLWCVETLSSVKHSDLMQKSLNELGRSLNVFIQVNTSGEENKGGIEIHELSKFYEYLQKNCSNLNVLGKRILYFSSILGLMTIGSVTQSTSNSQINSDFEALCKAKSSLEQYANKTFELSMGMSQDYELAIKYGSTNVRVGSIIFGARDYSGK